MSITMMFLWMVWVLNVIWFVNDLIEYREEVNEKKGA